MRLFRGIMTMPKPKATSPPYSIPTPGPRSNARLHMAPAPPPSIPKMNAPHPTATKLRVALLNRSIASVLCARLPGRLVRRRILYLLAVGLDVRLYSSVANEVSFAGPIDHSTPQDPGSLRLQRQVKALPATRLTVSVAETGSSDHSPAPITYWPLTVGQTTDSQPRPSPLQGPIDLLCGEVSHARMHLTKGS